MNTQQTPQSSLSASSSRQSHLRRSLKVKWLTYYRDNREWLTQLGVWINDSGERRPSSSFILATLSVLEPRLTQLMPIVVELNSNADQVVKALGLNFTPDDELERAIASGLISPEQDVLTNGHGSEPEKTMKFLPSTVSQPFVTTHEVASHQAASHEVASELSLHHQMDVLSQMPRPTIPQSSTNVSGDEFARNGQETALHVTLHPSGIGDANLQDSVDLYLDRSASRLQAIEHDDHREGEVSPDPTDEVHDEEKGRSPHAIAAKHDETCSGIGQADPFQTIRNIDIRI